ncbi:MAG: hypothetical protein ABIG96_02955 [Candidatus Micrarchaeota archaeon]
MEFDLDLMKTLFPPKKPVHMLKWGYPEARFSAAVEDVEKKIPPIKKGCKFAGGGEFMEEIHAKEYGPGIYAYFVVRTDKKTEEETIFADAYMLREEEKLGFDVQQAYKISENLDRMGYQHVFDRDIKVWSFRAGLKFVNAFDIADFGGFIEVGLPATKVKSIRDIDEKWWAPFFEKLGIKKEEVIPTDVITMQMMTIMQAEEEAAKMEGNAGGGQEGMKPQTGGKKLGFGGKGNLF